MEQQKLKNMSSEQMMQQAQHVWQMLDDMADNDPQGYRKFIDKQMKEGSEVMKPPKPNMCIQTKILKPEEDMIFMNVFEWVRVPEPKSDEAPIPVMGSLLYKGKDDTGVYKIVNVAFNPKVTEEFGIESDLLQERNMLINLAIDFIQDQHKLTISRNFTVLNKKYRYKGALKKAVEALTKKDNEQNKQFEKELGDLEKTLGPFAAGAKDSLLDKLSNITVEETQIDSEYVLDDTPISENIKEQEIKLPGEENSSFSKSKKSLIQEVENGGLSLPEPLYELKEISDSNSKAIRISLPGVSSVRECELDISQTDVHLLVKDKYELQVTLDNKIDEELAQAKFNKKSSTLTLTLTTLH